MKQDTLNKFMTVYEKNLKKAVETKPDHYFWPVSDVPLVADRMKNAIVKGTYNKDGFAFKWTCKELGIKYTYKDISLFLNQ